MEKKSFGKLPSGEKTMLYTISDGKVTAQVTDYGANLVRLWVPDKNGELADVVLGYKDAKGYSEDTVFLGATVGRNSNRIKGSAVVLGNTTFALTPNEGVNNLHSGPDFFSKRMWAVERFAENSITFRLESPNGDQGFPGNAIIKVTYTVEDVALKITYDAVSDRDTIFNLTNHSYFNMAGHDQQDLALEQELILPARVYTVADGEGIPTGEMRSVEGTPLDFRAPKTIGRDVGESYEALLLQGGYDHNFEVYTDPCAILTDPKSGRSMAITTDCPGVQFYDGHFLGGQKGKDGVVYGKSSGVCLETQFYPDAIHQPQWAQPVTKAGELYHSETIYSFK